MIDANTVVSAALNPNGVPRQAVAAARARGVVVLSEAVYREIAGVLARPKFARVLTEDRRREMLELLAAAARWIEPKQTVNDCRDAKDNCYLELALAAHATAIVSGDDDLLVLDPWRDIRVLPPARFLENFGAVES
ncbi:putative toxin-antitoxin system toxin component, PIN family [Sphingomonas sp.]|uniref:putative toxin-antitoxin system toxin component, PIN family n=1 Tax=Sphingomonas sp. TaxID=28214 RepID=UPI0025D2C40D|nr:putative toxin-antitoxin system toxin component, PIN family [Sphingomonas sp.]MBV9527881.1 putative toxin-antitoxin system toxin component, PIN family [Sphingomonas sp.]